MTTLKSARLFVLLLGLALCLAPAAAANDETGPVYDAQSAFEALKSFEGEWKSTPVGGDTSRASTVLYETTANGSSVIKTYGPGTQYEMFSVYHMDGDDLVMTHYCALGNQPKMKFRATGKPGEIYFDFDGGTNFDPAVDAHAHEGSTQVTGADTQSSMSIGHREGKPQPARHSNLVRVN